MIAASLARNLRAGARLAFFLPVRAFDFRVSPLDFAALLAFNCVLWIVAAGLQAGFAGDLDPRALMVYLASVALVLATALVVAIAYGAQERLLLIALALVSADALFEIMGLVLFHATASTGLGAWTYVLFFAWIWAVVVRAVAVTAGRQRPQIYQGTLAVSAMMGTALFLFPQAEVWKAPQAEEPAPALADERLFHRQGELIEGALAAIAPGRPGVRDYYFVGFAPDGSQDVFLREIRNAKRVFDERFGTAGRSIVLASSHQALDEVPIASVTNLGRALKRVAGAMNADEDVLVLVVTAHGDTEHRLSAWQPPLDLAPLTPTSLARLLQDAGIKWRVVVVSACYSGGFIEPLRDENSIIITAAAADRSSFGCEAGRDYTYFGQALFRDALATTRSFTDAFHLARKLVSQQEAAERLPASEPQMAAGRGIADFLKLR